MDDARILTLPPIREWHGPFDRDLTTRTIDALEAGGLIVLPNLPFQVLPEEADLLRPEILAGNRKNISLAPEGGRSDPTSPQGTSLREKEAARLAAMMRRFRDDARRLMDDLFPSYAPALSPARTSFRPARIEGRRYSPRQDDSRLHIDAFPSQPLRGGRILRLFTNIAPDAAPRSWRVGEPFPAFARRFLPRVPKPVPGTPWIMRWLQLTKGRRTPYDHFMLGLHDRGKLDADYQASAPAVPVSFPSGTSWLCYTDQVLHAVRSGHCALEQTFHLPVAAMRRPELSPLRVLESLTGRQLA